MTTAQNNNPAEQKSFRLWPGVLALVLQWLAWYVLPNVFPEALLYGVLGGVLGGGLAVLLWWLFFSRAPWLERVGVIVLMPVALFATSYFVHPSIANGMMGMMLPMYAIPVLCLALVAGAVASRLLSSRLRRAAMVATILLACGAFTLVRTGGITGDGGSDMHLRWTPTPEERLLALEGNEHMAPRSATTAVGTTAQWPGYRGPFRDGVVRGVHIAADWSGSPPTELWRKAVGPGWSSFAVSGDLVYTQEQRGDDEIVACYTLTTGQPVWMHHDATRFWESNAGAGPRATPTLINGRVYSLGATGIINTLDATDGTVAWSRNAAADTGKKVPGWGFAGSPLVVDDLVIVAAAGRLIAYDSATGDLRWLGPAGGGGYSSPHLATIDGVKQVLILNGAGITSFAPTSGTRLWTYAWEGDGIVQPALTTENDVLIGSGSGMGGAGMGVRRIAVAQGASGWTAEERWTSVGIKPYFNDFVVHGGHAFGFDGNSLACIELADGKRLWKGGRYGHGQVILLADQDVLLVLSEKGEMALVAATPDQFRELARFPALEGKTWNHPVLVGDILLVRNDHEMVAFRLALPSR
ncbi:MAG: PQQ-binding-like beta-propeller repeat protein [Gemmataceae bacterium]